MIIGVPKEQKTQEYRVGLTPDAVAMYHQAGHQIYVQTQAGVGSGFSDTDYLNSGAIIAECEEIWTKADMIIKVKEPLVSEYHWLRPGLIIYTYFHLAANRELTEQLLAKGVTSVAYETVQLIDGSLPLLTPMSEVAGRMAVQIGAQYLEKHHGGRGVLLGGIPGVKSGHVVIIGAGIVGINAATIALGMGAHVTIFDIDAKKLRQIDAQFSGRVATRISSPLALQSELQTCDLLIGAVLIPGASAPKIVTQAMVAMMPKGAVIVDVAIDQGGCIETITHATTHEQPTYEFAGVIHYAVANIPGAVPRTSTQGLVNVTTPYGLAIATLGLQAACEKYPEITLGINTYQGQLTYEPVASAHQLPYTAWNKL